MKSRFSVGWLLMVSVLMVSALVAPAPAGAIIGGNAASPVLPAVGTVYAAHYSSADIGHVHPLDVVNCTGTLVAQRWVLTAQHCTNINETQGKPFSAGDMNVTLHNSAGKSEKVGVSGIYRASGYYAPGGEQDVALLKLSSTITDITPMPFLASGGVAVLSTLYRYGYGQTSVTSTTFPNPLKYSVERFTSLAALAARPDQGGSCGSTATPPSSEAWTDSSALFSYAIGHGGSGEGDSGGPVLASIGGNRYALAGVTEGSIDRSDSCDTKADPTVLGSNFVGASNRVDQDSRLWSFISGTVGNPTVTGTTATPAACASTLGYGTALACTIATAGEQDRFTLVASAGDRIRIHTAATTNTVSPSTAILAPGGAVACSATTVDDLDCTATSSGTYTVTVRDFAGTNTGGYVIAAQRLNAPAGCATMTFASQSNGVLAAGGVRCYRLYATVGDRIRLHTAALDSTLTPNTDVINPVGSTACSATTTDDLDCTATTTGTYTVTVRDFWGSGTGSYALTAQRLNNPIGCTGLSYGMSTPTVALGAGDVECFRLTAAAGDRVRIHTVTPTSALTPATDLIGPGGAVACSATTTADLDCAAATAGTYTVTVRDFWGDGSGSVVLSAQRLNNPVGCKAVSYGGSVAEYIASGVRCYRLPVVAGDRVRVHTAHVSGSLSPDTDLIAPNGAVACSATTAADLNCAATATGTYTVTVRDFWGDGSGGFVFSPQRLSNPVGCSALSSGAPTAGTVDVGKVRCYRIPSTAGRTLHITIATAAGADLTPATDVIGAAGAATCTRTTSNSYDCTTPTTATYTLYLSDFWGTGTGGYTLTIA